MANAAGACRLRFRLVGWAVRRFDAIFTNVGLAGVCKTAVNHGKSGSNEAQDRHFRPFPRARSPFPAIRRPIRGQNPVIHRSLLHISGLRSEKRASNLESSGKGSSASRGVLTRAPSSPARAAFWQCRASARGARRHGCSSGRSRAGYSPAGPGSAPLPAAALR